MELKTQVKALNYTKKLLFGETDSILPWPAAPEKPDFDPGSRHLISLPRSVPEQEGVSSKVLEDFLYQLSAIPEAAPHCVMVARHGRMILSAGFAPYSTSVWHVTHSLCKSVVGLAVGMLIDEGKLKLNDLLSDIFPEQFNLFTSRRTRLLTVRHLLTMSSGNNFREAGAILEKDWLRGFFESDMVFEPGTRFDYNSMNSYVLSAIVKKRSGQGLMEYLTPRLFDVLGFGPVAWEKCPMGIEKGGWGMYLMPEDMAKLGLLYQNDGMWTAPDGTRTQVVSEKWAKAARSVQITGEEKGYGYQVWAFGDGTFALNGMFGQYVFGIPQQDMVVVLCSGSPNIFAESEAFRLMRQTFLPPDRFGGAPLPANAENYAALTDLAGRLCFGRASARPLPPLPWYRRLWRTLTRQKALPPPRVPENARALLTGRRFSAPTNRAGLLPLIAQCMEGNYTPGVKSLAFMEKEGLLELAWEEGDRIYGIPLDFLGPREFLLEAGGEHWRAAALVRLTPDEDGNPVLRLLLCLPEHSSARCIKLAFLPGKTMLKFDETPSLLSSLEQMSGSTQMELFEGIFKDSGYARYMITRLCAPQFALQEITASE